MLRMGTRSKGILGGETSSARSERADNDFLVKQLQGRQFANATSGIRLEGFL